MLWKIGLALLGIVVLTLVVMVFKLAMIATAQRELYASSREVIEKMTGSLCLFRLAGCIRRDDNKNHNKSRWN